MSVAAQNAAASWRIRRRNRSAIFTLNCTPWSPGLVCSPGAVCQSNGLAWTTAEAGQSRAVDMFLNFPVMDMNRNAIWRNPDQAPRGGADRMNRFWGDELWKRAAYAESRQHNLFSSPDLVKQGNDAIVAAFQERLNAVAGFSVVPAPLPMKNSSNAVV